ncbi:sensor histidine kinase [Tuwongella immobilis]|uniref:histidine kinase n=1 Tax=Tuwongella immobilis TaxID=692036 RepID=A0A6C2YSW0_9BACT|nr:HAMP domain-containing sensor histidine kinase [Tuwongella immobilis]VIP04223.1 histidine kinase : Histidine kinase OS=Pirellula staleyi (strain ATCC 27377 / DSM 6068 / ICPB 4128) GN=Psta_1094 PE=4 SV=1: HisKA: HATPase_c [Tuwongella immobilis]VTS05810.1 histidine kinase : Histidine kinase OS=Pirellula staleyi (strain ATCC 27377 / DSM 6068 / ICPB 4128) GN=Psta_1094 PE=4 SV=1: HisKA: HATPase_c [Tuwongella immobilis]
MPVSHPMDVAVRVRPLVPTLASIVTLTQPITETTWSRLRHDPALGLLLAEFAPSSPRFDAATLRRPELIDRISATLAAPDAGWIDWSAPLWERKLLALWHFATQADAIAARCAVAIDRDALWLAAMVAPVGWLLNAADHPSPTANWTDDASDSARRYAHMHHWPDWLLAAATHLALPWAVAVDLGADPHIHAILQLASVDPEIHAHWPLVPMDSDLAEARNSLGLTPDDLRHLPAATPAANWSCDDPRRASLIQPLLDVCLRERRAAIEPKLAQLESELDRLRASFRRQISSEQSRLRDAKIAAMAEFSAGASHEINNPLAVISGQAQLMLSLEEEPSVIKGLECILRQTHRIHSILSELMQFARPPQPKRIRLDIRAILREAIYQLQDLQEKKQLTIELDEPDEPIPLIGDARQMMTMLTGLLRNAEQAAPVKGWVRIRLEIPTGNQLAIHIEDNGPGVPADIRDHLFDPFFSGRNAGRGRGLGLPTAWRLARQHGGSVEHAPATTGPTRFTLRLPLNEPEADAESRERRSA